MSCSNLPVLATSRQVIAVHLQGHDHTTDIDRPLRFEFMADDIAALIAYLKRSTGDLCRDVFDFGMLHKPGYAGLHLNASDTMERISMACAATMGRVLTDQTSLGSPESGGGLMQRATQRRQVNKRFRPTAEG